MTPADEPHRDELQDSLMDQALRELLGGEAPPDLSDKILAAAKAQNFVSPQQKEQVMGKHRRWYRPRVIGVAVACSVVGVLVALMLPALQSSRQAARQQTQNSLRPLGAARHTNSVTDSITVPNLGRDTGFGVEGQADFDDMGLTPDGRGPGLGGDQYERIIENPFQRAEDHPLSTFSIDVDTASFANVRRFLLRDGRLPPPDAVRIEELINYFDYDYAGPEDETPFASHLEVAACPWTEEHRLVRVALKGRVIESEVRPASNLVFLLDVSGSMQSADKLPLLKEGMKLLVDQMRENDRVAIVVYASSEGLVLPATPGSQGQKIIAALDALQAGGSTAGGAGIELAYRIARENFIPEGVNRVLLCTDGDFNVGTTSPAALERMVEERAKSGVFLSVLGFGRGNLNDAMMERISNKGNGNYGYIDSIAEARKMLVQQALGTLITIAKDVKIQIEFNPVQVAAYRLIGYENRILAAEDFSDDTKDAGEIGAGHAVTALYEIVPPGVDVNISTVEPLKYRSPAASAGDPSVHDELLTLKIRYKDPQADKSKRLEFTLRDTGKSFGQADQETQFAAAVASFGMLLRNSQYKGMATYDGVLEIASSAKGRDEHGYRTEFLEMVRRAKLLNDRSQ